MEPKNIPNQTQTHDQPSVKLMDRASAWTRANPVKTSLGVVAGANLAIKGGEKLYNVVKDRFADKATSPAKEQAASFVAGVARGFSKRFG